jgi:dynein heavy chain
MSYWRASISTLVLADPNLPETLEKFDRKRLTEDKMKLLEELMADPDYTIEGVRKCNAAAEGFFKWIKSLRDFYYIFKELQPRKDALLESERLYQIQLDESSKIKD